MKEFSQQQINDAQEHFTGQRYPVERVTVGGETISYWVLPQDLEPGLPDFAFRMTGTDRLTNKGFGIFGLSDSVPAPLRPYWVAHEIIEFTQIGITQKGRCAEAESRVLGLVPLELRHAYTIRRLEFFNNLIRYFRSRPGEYNSGDLQEAESSFRHLELTLGGMATRAPHFEEEYRVLREVMGLSDPIVKYPACGSDISSYFVFPNSPTYYIDPDKAELEKIKNSGLPAETTHIVNQSAYEYSVPVEIDLVILRNASTDQNDIVGLTKGLRDGGFVIESHWGSTYGARELLSDPKFCLIGVMRKIDDQSPCRLDRDIQRIASELQNDSGSISKVAGKGYVFQKRLTPLAKFS